MLKRGFSIALVLLVAVAVGAQESAEQQFANAFNYGTRYYESGQFEYALDWLSKAEAIQPNHPALMYNVAAVLFKLGRYSDAQSRIDRYMQLYPQGAEKSKVDKLQSEINFGRDQQTRRAIAQAYLTLFNNGKFLFAQGKVDDALRVFEEAEQQKPKDPAVAYNQALAYEAKGDYEHAIQKLRRYQSLNEDAADKGAVDQKIFALESEMADMKTKFVCSFCGTKLPEGTTWCHRCWHGPYLGHQPHWNSRPCGAGASALRTTMRPGDRIDKNEDLSCQFSAAGYAQALRYSPARQQAIRSARTAEGWTYDDAKHLKGWRDANANELALEQGPDYLRRIVSPGTGEALHYAAHKAGDSWLLDSEELFIEGQRFFKYYTFDEKGRIAQETVRYDAVNACNHTITSTATYTWGADRLESVQFNGHYDGYQVEGVPSVRWEAGLTFTYDPQGRVSREELTVSSHTKTFAARPQDKHRDELERLYQGMRVKRPLDILARGDFCAFSGLAPVGNPIDLRPFYTVSPNVAMQLPFGVNKVTVSFTYPDGYRLAARQARAVNAVD